MAVRSQPARRTTDRIESLAVWILIAAGLLVVLLVMHRLPGPR